MSTEIHNQLAGSVLTNAYTKTTDHPVQDHRITHNLPISPNTEQSAPVEHLKVLHADIQKIVEDLQKVGNAFNRRLDFEVNQESGQVIVRVLNSETGELIKVLPPDELQLLHLRIKETVGLLIDEKI